jgi:hypothetical protein
MKKLAFVTTVLSAVVLSGCGTFSKKDTESSGLMNPGTQQAISEQRLVSDFKRQGVRVIYTITGGLEAIEATGYAPVWGNSPSAAREAFRVAELEAKKAVNDFINSETIQSTVSVKMISRNLEKATDNKANNFASNRSESNITSDDELLADDPTGQGSVSNTALRNDALSIASRVSTNINIQSQGIISGMYLVEGRVIDRGRNVQVVYRWDRKHNNARKTIRSLMMQ